MLTSAETIHVGVDHQFAVTVGGIGDEQIQPPELLHRCRHHRFNGRPIGHVGPNHDRLPAERLDLPGDFVRFVFVGMKVDGDVRAFAGQLHRAAAPDTA